MSLKSSSTEFSSDRSFLRYHFGPYLFSIVSASLCSLFLGVISTVIVTLIGPSIQLLLEPSANKTFLFSELFGSKIAKLITYFTHLDRAQSSTLITFLPIALVVVSLAKAIIYIIQVYFWERTSESVTRDLRSLAMKKYLKLSSFQKSHKKFLAVEASFFKYD